MTAMATGGGRRSAPATEPQKRCVRRLVGGYVRDVGYVPHGPAFSKAEHAVAYALARAFPIPGALREASEMIETLRSEKPGGGIFGWARQRTPQAARLRRDALGVLARRYGYPGEGWLGRFNEAVRVYLEPLDEGQRRRLALDPVRYRRDVLDGFFRDAGGRS